MEISTNKLCVTTYGKPEACSGLQLFQDAPFSTVSSSASSSGLESMICSKS